MARDFEWLQDEVSKWLNFNPTQANQDFTAQQIKDAINDAYKDEVNTAKLQCNPAYFKVAVNMTWEADTLTKAAPKQLLGSTIYKVKDVTDNDPGYELIFSRDGTSGDLWWQDRETLQWGSAGPSSDKTIRFEYFAEPIDMVEDGDEPILVPSAHRRLIVLSAAISLRDMADEGAPQAWLIRLQNYRIDLWKYMKLGRPMTDVPVFVTDTNDVDVGYVY